MIIAQTVVTAVTVVVSAIVNVVKDGAVEANIKILSELFGIL